MDGVLGLDGSTKRTGFSYGRPDRSDAVTGGAWDTPGVEQEVRFFTFSRLYRSTFDLCRLVKPAWVIIEANITPFHNSNMTTILGLAQVVAILGTAATNTGAKVELVSSKTIRKLFVGRGNFTKKEDPKLFVQAKCDEYGWSYTNHDHADALAAMAYGLTTHYPGWSPRSTPLFGRKIA